MPASGLYMNWAPVTFTPNGGSLITLNEILGIDLTRGGKLIAFYGDARRFARGKKMVENERGAKIHLGNIGQVAGIEEGVVGTLVATLQDMNNGIGAGAITFTLINAVIKSNPFTGKNNAFAEGTMEFEAYADSSDTDPLSFVIA